MTTSPLEASPPFPSDHPLAGLETSVDQLRECGQLFHGRGWSVGTSSNYSVVIDRQPLELLITASGMDKGRLRPDDFVRVDQQGVPTRPGQPRSSAETLLHAVAARDANVGAVLHTHSVWGTLLSDHFYSQGGFEISGYEMLKGLAGITTHETTIWVAIFDNTQDMEKLSQQVHLRMDDPDRPLKHGYLIRRHGLYTWGKDLAEARRQIEIFEFLFECVARQMILSRTTALPGEI